MDTPDITPKDALSRLTENGWSYNAIAEQLGVSASTIMRVARGSEPSYTLGWNLVALANSENIPGNLRN